ncbi:AbrB/MazE/SpoVT family DNA-binding domain-containing protein [Halorussus caseinilyticus]|uniref:AbrB/MazE/SpoVT family DNA-binding domain-containing protein n=1 Tax=Halorussus caseinilyticus TaxID=3034025 RepID=A0ABD5WU75_9EURY|nr:AbrB/MazE/SpoVT family DNA-binding domain-containing protein [Halorussus sp. DT72]
MGGSEKRKVGERGQITLPKDLRKRFGIHGGDEVIVSEEDDKIVIETPVSEADLAEGYRRRADRDREIADAFDGVSREAAERVGDVPDW